MKTVETQIVYRNPHGYASWPSILILQSGGYAIFFCEAMRRHRTIHRDPTALNMAIFSPDGRKWDEPPTVVPGYGFSGVDDPGATQLSTGEILVNTYQFDFAPNLPGPSQAETGWPWRWVARRTGWVHRSVDEGLTWSTAPVDPGPFRAAFTLRPIVELGDGTLVLSCYDEIAKPSVCFTVRSLDRGRTWVEPLPLASAPGISFYEPCLLDLPRGMIALLRTHAEGGNRLHQCESTDGGRTWSAPEATNMLGYPAHAIRLRDGRVLCVYGVRFAPFGIRARLSEDGGRTWADPEIVIHDDFPTGDLGYPTAVEEENGDIAVAYYGRDEEGVTGLFLSRLRDA